MTAPLVWLEKTRGIGRLALVLFYALILGVVGVYVWRAAALNGLPDIPAPLTMLAVRSARVADESNAYVQYRQASAMMIREPRLETTDLLTVVDPGWENISEPYQRWLESNRPALEVWRDGTDRPDAINLSAIEFPGDDGDTLLLSMRALAMLGLLEAARLEQQEDMAGAWQWYWAVLRSSRHLGMHAPWDARLVGMEIHGAAATLVNTWATRKGVSTDQLRQALDDVQLLAAMTPRNSDTFRYQYVVLDRKVANIERWLPVTDSVLNEEPPSVPYEKPITRFLRNEPERSHRVLKHIFTNWLTVCDLPPEERLAPVPVGLGYFRDSSSKSSARLMDPDLLHKWYMSSELSKIEFPAFSLADDTWKERTAYARMVVTLAEQWYLREQKKMPASVDDLLGLYLKRIPDGYEPEIR